MRYKITLAIIAFINLQLVAQQTVDTNYITTYYEQKLTLFRQLPNTKNEIIFLGNSITDIGEWAEIWENKNVKNRGISSDNTFGVLARLDEITASKPKKVFIMIGINDISKSTPDSIIFSNYKKIISTIQSQSSKTQIIIQSILPTNNSFTQFVRHQNKDEHIKWMNEKLYAYCLENNIVFVDLHSQFLNTENKLDKQYTNDGLHLNGTGYMKWKAILKQLKLMK